MKFYTTHFTFETVGEHNLDVLRRFRNAPTLRGYMVHNQEISEEQQTKWFAGIDHAHNIYFLVQHENEYIGYTLLKNINYENSTGEPGTFLINENLHGTSMAALFMLSFLDICYYFFGVEYFFGNVLNTNTRALANYRIFNPEYVSKTATGELYLKAGDGFNYLQATGKIRKALHTIYNYTFNLTIQPEPDTDPPAWLTRHTIFSNTHS